MPQHAWLLGLILTEIAPLEERQRVAQVLPDHNCPMLQILTVPLDNGPTLITPRPPRNIVMETILTRTFRLNGERVTGFAPSGIQDGIIQI